MISTNLQKKKMILPLFALLALTYIFISSRPAEEYPILFRTEVIRLQQTATLPRLIQTQPLIQFETSERMGLINSANTVVALTAKNGKNVLGPGFYFEAFPEQKKMILDDFINESRIELPYYGYPFSRAGRILILRPDQMGALEVDKKGTIRWIHEFGTTITAFSAQTTISAWGDLSGTLLLLDDAGNRIDIDSNQPWRTSSFQCVYAVAISKDQKAFAVIAGYKPLMMSLYKKDGAGFKLAKSIRLSGKADAEILMTFSNDGSWLMAALPDGLAMLDTHTGRYLYQEQKSTMQSLTPFEQSQMSALVHDSNGKKIEIYDKGVKVYALPVEESTYDVVDGLDSLILTEDLELPGKLTRYGIKK